MDSARPRTDPFTLLESPSGNLRNVLVGEGPQDSQPFTSLLWTPTPCTTACCIWEACIKIPASNDSDGAILGSLNIAPVLRRALSKLQSRCRAHDRSSKRPCQFCAIAISRSTSVLLAPAFWQPANTCERPTAAIDRVASAAVRSQEPPVAGAAVARREPRLAHSNILSFRLLARDGWQVGVWHMAGSEARGPAVLPIAGSAHRGERLLKPLLPVQRQLQTKARRLVSVTPQVERRGLLGNMLDDFPCSSQIFTPI